MRLPISAGTPRPACGTSVVREHCSTPSPDCSVSTRCNSYACARRSVGGDLPGHACPWRTRQDDAGKQTDLIAATTGAEVVALKGAGHMMMVEAPMRP